MENGAESRPQPSRAGRLQMQYAALKKVVKSV